MDVEGATFATWHPRYVMTGYSWDALAGPHLTLRPKVRRAFGAAFRPVRVFRPPLGFNEILVGGDGCHTGSALRPFADRLAEPRDRMLLGGVRVRLLRRKKTV